MFHACWEWFDYMLNRWFWLVRQVQTTPLRSLHSLFAYGTSTCAVCTVCVRYLINQEIKKCLLCDGELWIWFRPFPEFPIKKFPRLPHHHVKIYINYSKFFSITMPNLRSSFETQIDVSPQRCLPTTSKNTSLPVTRISVRKRKASVEEDIGPKMRRKRVISGEKEIMKGVVVVAARKERTKRTVSAVPEDAAVVRHTRGRRSVRNNQASGWSLPALLLRESRCSWLFITELINQSIDRSMNQSVKQQLINQSIHQFASWMCCKM